MIDKKIIQMGYMWYAGAKTSASPKVCQNRAIFQARLSSLFHEMVVKYSKEKIMLLNAVVAEIGINCFDHNIGKWKDISGCLFDYEITKFHFKK